MASCPPAVKRKRAASRASSKKFASKNRAATRASSKKYYKKHASAIKAQKKRARKSTSSGGGSKGRSRKVGRPRKSC